MPGNPFQGPMSEPQTPQPRTRMRTSPSPGSGVSMDSIWNWRGSIRIADRMVLLAPSPPARGRGTGRGGMGSNLPRRPQQRAHRLAVVDLAADGLVHGVFEGEALQLEHLVLVEALAGLFEPLGEEEPDLLVAEAGGGPDPAQRLELGRAEAGLLLGLADRAGLRLLVLLQLARGDFQEPAARGVAVLADHQHVVPDHRDHCHGPLVMDQLQVHHLAVWEADGVHGHVDRPPRVDFAG